jgi:amino acid adenylation domain-containing protein
VVQQGKRLTDAELVSVLEQFVNQVRRGEPIKLGGEARKWVWREFGGGGELDSSGWCLHSFFHQQVSKAPDRIAVSHEGKDLTYGELNAAANQLAHELIARGVSTDKPVGLFLDRSFDMVIAILAILKAGGPYLPLDPDYPDERVRFMLEDARVEIVVTRSDLSEKLPSLAASLLCMDQERFTLEGRSKSNPDVCVNPADLAYIIYTSGSSGRPKGVMIEHRAAAHFVHAAMSHYGMDSSDCMLQFGSISFDLAVEEIFTCLAAGGRLRLRTKEMLGTPARFLQCCQDWGVTILDLPTAYWQQLVTEMAHTGSRFPAGVRLVIIGGERVVPSVVELWQRHVGDYPRLFNSYGPTEATVVATGHWIGGSMKPRHEVPIGRPLSNSEVYILDSELRAVPIGVPGELYLGGRSLARGYLNLPELTANRFIANPFHPERDARLYKTGDRARYLSDGTIEFLGRLDHQVKLRGFRIELGEIESALLRFPGIKEAVVLAQNDGSGSQFLAAYVVTQSKEMVSEQVVKTFLRQSLPGYMIPLFVRSLRCLPLDPNGKIDVRALPVPSPVDHPSGDRPFACPSSPLEEKLAAIWCDVLRVPKVSVSDRFFDLGGHSLQAVQIMTRIRREIGVELPLSALFESPSVEEMSKRLGKAGFEASWSPLVPFQAGGRKRPFFAIHGGHGEVLFYKSLSKHLGGDQPFYALRAKGNDFPGMPDQSVEEMATCYTQAIREIQPAGPYRIGGASFGGIVAFEMAQQLHAAGETVELLVLFDTGGFREFTKPLPLPTRLLNLFRYLPRYGFEETWHRLRVRLLRLFVSDSVVEFYRATGTLPKKSSDTIGRWEGVWKANLAASERYVPRVYPGAISLIRARDDGNYMWFDCDPGYGWDEYAGGGVIGYDVPGTHIGMFQEPYVKDLAQTMVRLLEGRAAAI